MEGVGGLVERRKHANDHEQKRNTCKRIVSPSVRGRNQRANQKSNNPRFLQHDGVQTHRPRHAAVPRQVEKKARKGQEPANEPCVKHLPDTWRRNLLGLNRQGDMVELGLRAGPAQVGRHCEIENGHYKEHKDGRVVEDTLGGAACQGQGGGDEGAEGKDAENGPEPVRAMFGDVEIDAGRGVDFDRLVTSRVQDRHVGSS